MFNNLNNSYKYMYLYIIFKTKKETNELTTTPQMTSNPGGFAWRVSWTFSGSIDRGVAHFPPLGFYLEAPRVLHNPTRRGIFCATLDTILLPLARATWGTWFLKVGSPSIFIIFIPFFPFSSGKEFINLIF
jgi:hypothetical protein